MKEISIPDILLTKKQKSQSVGIHLYDGKNEQRQRVLFSQNVISFLIQGRKDVFLDHDPIVVDSSQFSLFTSTRCIMTETFSGENAYQSMLLFFDDSFLEKFKVKHHNLILDPIKQQSIGVFKYDKYVTNFRESLLYLFDEKQQSEFLVETKCEEILLYLCDKYPQKMSSILSRNHSKNEIRFKQIVEKNLLSNVTIEELAFLCKMSLSSFNRFFEKQYQSSPGKWLLKERMKLAGSLLQKKKTPSEVYGLFGYETYSNFAKAFKKEHQVSPQLFQKMNPLE